MIIKINIKLKDIEHNIENNIEKSNTKNKEL